MGSFAERREINPAGLPHLTRLPPKKRSIASKNNGRLEAFGPLTPCAH